MEEELAQVWRALADPRRRRILDLLRERPRKTGELSEAFGDVTRFTIMKHLEVLEQAGLVLVRRRGRERWNHLNAVPIQQIAERWIRPYEASLATSLLRLKDQAEERRGEAMVEISSLQVEQEVRIDAETQRVWDALTAEVEAWWGTPYLMGQARRLVLEARPGGLMREEWADGDGAVWGVVTAVERGRRLELQGPMAMAGPVAGVIRFLLEPFDGTTRLQLSHQVFGHLEPETGRNYERGWQDLLGVRLKAFVEEGVRYGLGQPPPPGAPSFETEEARR